MLALVSTIGVSPALAGPAEPLVVERLSDPDPYYVPPRAERRSAEIADRDATSALDQAMQDFGRAIGQAAMLERQALQSRCGSGAPVSATPADRMAWEASCRYSRR